MTAVNSNVPLSPGAQLLYDRIKAPASQPLWILCWGGTNTLAQALLKLEASFPSQDLKRLLSRVRVYAISDQDDTGTWIRSHYPQIFYIASIHAWNQYGLAAWTGISGEKYYGFDHGGPNSTVMEKDWIKENIQIGPLGSAYPDHLSIAEGATPTFLYLIQNGLGSSDNPKYGSWGGRYAHTDISSDGLDSNHCSDVVDHVKISDRIYTSNHATIWRWREAFQNDFAARIKWSVESDFSKANHHPVVTINGSIGLTPVRIGLDSNSTVSLDASGTYDPTGKTLSYKWWQYLEPTATQWQADLEVPLLEIKKIDTEGQKVQVKVLPLEKQNAVVMDSDKAESGQLLHLILEVTNDGIPALTSYRRVLIQVVQRPPPPPPPQAPQIEKSEVDGIREGVKNL